MIAVGARVRPLRGPRDIGTVRELVDTKRGRRALVHWKSDGCEQYVDLDQLREVERARRRFKHQEEERR